jgi:hypothetical protein
MLVASVPATVIGQADRIVTRRLRHSGSFIVCSPRALQESSKWMGPSPRPGRCDVETTSPWRCVGLRSRSRLHWSSTGPLRRLRELDIAPRISNKAGSSPALRNEADPEHYHGEAFSPLAPSRSYAHRRQTPLSPMRMRPSEHASCVGGRE